MPVRTVRRGLLWASALAAALVAGCSLGGGGGDAGGEGGGATGTPQETGPDVEALRAAWAEAVNRACADGAAEIAQFALGLPVLVERRELSGAAAELASIEEGVAARMREVAPAPGDEELVEGMVTLYEQAGELRSRALAVPYAKRDRKFYAHFGSSEEARAEANAIAADLGATECTKEPPGRYASVDELAAVRWGDRASTLCRARDRTQMRLRPTDAAAHEAAARKWLRETRGLEPPKRYARKIKRSLDLFEEHFSTLEATSAAFNAGDIAGGEALNEKTNRLLRQSTDLFYDVGITIGFQRFCSTRPA